MDTKAAIITEVLRAGKAFQEHGHKKQQSKNIHRVNISGCVNATLQGKPLIHTDDVVCLTWFAHNCRPFNSFSSTSTTMSDNTDNDSAPASILKSLEKRLISTVKLQAILIYTPMDVLLTGVAMQWLHTWC